MDGLTHARIVLNSMNINMHAATVTQAGHTISARENVHIYIGFVLLYSKHGIQ